jgi:hypothetical protein
MNTRQKGFMVVLAGFLISSVLLISPADCFEKNSLMEGVRFQEYQNGGKVLLVSAERAYLANHRLGFFQVAWKRVLYLENADVTFYNTKGKQNSSISMPLAILDPEEKSLYDINGKPIH